MDAHVHLTHERGMDSRQDLIDSLAQTPAEAALRATKYLRVTLDAGFTTVRNLGASDFVDVALRNAVAAGAIAGPRILAASKGLGSLGGHCDSNGFAPDGQGNEHGTACAGLIGAIPGVVLSVLVFVHRTDLVDHRISARSHAAEHGEISNLKLFLQLPILICLGYFALVAVNTVGVQQFAVPAWERMFGVSEKFAAICLIVFVVGSAMGTLLGGFFADGQRNHERVAATGLAIAAIFTVPVATASVPALLLPVVLALGGFANGTTGPSRDMIVRSATPPGAGGSRAGAAPPRDR